jgi:hypothetical protein
VKVLSPEGLAILAQKNLNLLLENNPGIPTAQKMMIRRDLKEEFIKANAEGKLYESYKKYCNEVLETLEKYGEETQEVTP